MPSNTPKLSTQQLSSALIELLYKHDCVLIPGLGGLMSFIKPAQVDANHRWAPAYKQFVLNGNIQHDDGLLAAHIAKQLNINELTANDQIKKWVDSLLDQKETIVLSGIGVLQFNTVGILTFVPQQNQNFNLQSFGLNTLLAPPVHRAVQNSTSYTRQIAAAILFLFVSASIFYVYLGQQQIVSTPSIHTQLGSIANLLDISHLNQASTSNQRQTEQIQPQQQIPVIAEKEVIQTPSFFIVIGSFKNSTNAQELLQSELVKQYNLELLAVENGWTRVGYFAGYTEMQGEQSLLQAKVNYKNAWLLTPNS